MQESLKLRHSCRWICPRNREKTTNEHHWGKKLFLRRNRTWYRGTSPNREKYIHVELLSGWFERLEQSVKSIVVVSWYRHREEAGSGRKDKTKLQRYVPPVQTTREQDQKHAALQLLSPNPLCPKTLPISKTNTPSRPPSSPRTGQPRLGRTPRNGPGRSFPIARDHAPGPRSPGEQEAPPQQQQAPEQAPSRRPARRRRLAVPFPRRDRGSHRCYRPRDIVLAVPVRRRDRGSHRRHRPRVVFVLLLVLLSLGGAHGGSDREHG